MGIDDRAWNLIVAEIQEIKQDNAKAHEKIIKLLTTQNSRIRKLENWRIYLTGIAAGMVALIGGFFHWLK